MSSGPPTRSDVMSRVRGRDTGPELRVRRSAHALGLRFRLHRGDLPGTPDLVFPRYRTALFVHGCFWHRHKGCALSRFPKSNVAFWSEKFRSNVARDRRQEHLLAGAGWRVEIIWECQTRDPTSLRETLAALFSSPPRDGRDALPMDGAPTLLDGDVFGG